jgi:hypothetical protein
MYGAAKYSVNRSFDVQMRWNGITRMIHATAIYKDAINHSSIRHGSDLALLESAGYYPSLPRAIDRHRNDLFPLAWEAVVVDAKFESSDQVAAEK